MSIKGYCGNCATEIWDYDGVKVDDVWYCDGNCAENGEDTGYEDHDF